MVKPELPFCYPNKDKKSRVWPDKKEKEATAKEATKEEEDFFGQKNKYVYAISRFSLLTFLGEEKKYLFSQFLTKILIKSD